MSTVTFRHEKSRSEKTKNGNKSVRKEMLIDGEKGLTFTFLYKDGDDENKFYKIAVKSEDGKKYTVVEKKGEKETTTEMSKAEVEKITTGDKNLAFALLYMTKGPSALKSSKGKKKAKKVSKKAKKKVSKKAKKKVSKKVSKKAKKKVSKKSSKKAKKKVSKKSMKGGKAKKKVSKKAKKKVSKKSKKK